VVDAGRNHQITQVLSLVDDHSAYQAIRATQNSKRSTSRTSD
jgi:hypothetical protein